MRSAMRKGDAVVSQASRVAKYQAYLATKAAQGDEQAKETAQGFSALPAAQKTRFLGLLEDRSLMKQLFEAAESPAAAGITRSVLAGGDVVVERESAGGDDASPNSSAVLRAAGNHDMWCDFSRSPVKEWISLPPADNAQSETIWTASCWGSSWDERERVWGDYRGFVGGYLKDE